MQQQVLFWRDFGYEAIKKYFPNTNLYEVWNSVDKMLIQGIDATDNGVNNTSSQEVAAMSICQMISNYNLRGMMKQIMMKLF